jgi:hypothetical protein
MCRTPDTKGDIQSRTIPRPEGAEIGGNQTMKHRPNQDPLPSGEHPETTFNLYPRTSGREQRRLPCTEIRRK